MLQKYPSGQFAANAHYWLGELYGLMGKNDQSISEFGNVVKNYPDSPKIADAQLKLGLIYAAQLKWPDARTSFKKVINHYPGTASAHLASEQLKQIKQAGH
jgi:tol-pal system protein YbgF